MHKDEGAGATFKDSIGDMSIFQDKKSLVGATEITAGSLSHLAPFLDNVQERLGKVEPFHEHFSRC